MAVSELSGLAFAQSLEMGSRLEDVAGTIHAHRHWVRRWQEAALRAWLGHQRFWRREAPRVFTHGPAQATGYALLAALAR